MPCTHTLTRHPPALWHHSGMRAHPAPRFRPPAPAIDAPRRRLLGALAGFVGLAAIGAAPAARAGFNFFTGEYTASRAELQAQVARRFPLQRGYAGLISLTLRAPRLGLDAAGNRIRLDLALDIASPLLQPAELPGTLALSSALRYDAPTLSLRLEQPRAEQLRLTGIAGTDAERLQRVAAAVAQEALQGQALHTFRREDLTLGRKTYEIGTITVLEDAVKVQLL